MKLAAAIVATAVLAAPQAAAKPAPPQQLLGFVAGSRGVSVVRLDATSLRPVSRAAPAAGTNARYVGRSLGGGRLAIWNAAGGGTLRFLDFERMRWEGGVDVPGSVEASLWKSADRLVLVTGGPTAAVLVVNPITRRIRARHPLRGPLAAVATGQGVVVALVAPLDGIGATRIAVVDAGGRVRIAPLAGIRAGGGVAHVEGPEPFIGLFERPALAVDPLGNSAAAISADGTVAEVRLNTLAVTANRLASHSLAFTTKVAVGHARSARWIGTNTIALTGSDAWLEDGVQRWSSAGLTLVDTRDWSERKIDATTSDIAFNAGTLLAFGGYWNQVGPGVFRSVGDGLAGYSTGGFRQFHLFEGQLVRPACVAGTYAYFSEQNGTRFTIVDTRLGTVVRTVATRTPTSLASLASS